MSTLYGPPQRGLQDRFGTRRLADRLEQTIVHAVFTADEKAFVESRDLFFLATVDRSGRPTVSYKGGAPGFVRVQEPSTLLFPCYDGNGMYYSAGNLVAHPEVGLLFVDLEDPRRLRVQGRAVISFAAADLACYVDAQFVVRVTATEIWVNCGRYIHRYRKLEPSEDVPREGRAAPVAAWKTSAAFSDVIAPRAAEGEDGEDAATPPTDQ